MAKAAAEEKAMAVASVVLLVAFAMGNRMGRLVKYEVWALHRVMRKAKDLDLVNLSRAMMGPEYLEIKARQGTDLGRAMVVVMAARTTTIVEATIATVKVNLEATMAKATVMKKVAAKLEMNRLEME